MKQRYRIQHSNRSMCWLVSGSLSERTPVFLTPLHGHTSFAWLDGGAFLIMHSEIDEPEVPSGIAIIGSDDATDAFSMLYFDERGVSRKYNVSFKKNVLTWWRDTPEFSQRFTITISTDGRTMVGIGTMKKEDAEWENDLALTFTRIAEKNRSNPVRLKR